MIRFGSIFICVTFMFYLKTCLHWDKWCNLPLKIKIIKAIITSGFCSAVQKIPRRKENIAQEKKALAAVLPSKQTLMAGSKCNDALGALSLLLG